MRPEDLTGSGVQQNNVLDSEKRHCHLRILKNNPETPGGRDPGDPQGRKGRAVWGQVASRGESSNYPPLFCRFENVQNKIIS